MCENCEIDILVVVSLHGDQLNELTSQLIQEKFYFTRLNSGGGVLNFRSNSLLIGIRHNRYKELKNLLANCCRRQLTHIPTQIQLEANMSITHPMAIEAEIGGASIYSIPVEDFEQF